MCCTHVYVICTQVCLRGWRRMLCVLLYPSPSYSSETGSVTEPGVSLVANKPRPSPCLLPTLVPGLQMCVTVPGFSRGCWGGAQFRPSCLHREVQLMVFPTQLSPQAPHVHFNPDFSAQYYRIFNF